MCTIEMIQHLENYIQLICAVILINLLLARGINAESSDAKPFVFNSSSLLIGAWIRADINNSHLSEQLKRWSFNLNIFFNKT